MSQFLVLLFFVITYNCASVHSSPIMDSENVGKVSLVDKQVTVTGQSRYPYIVSLEIKQRRNGKKVGSSCGGVIIGLDAVLTAAHCLYNKNDPEIMIWAGVVEVRHENDNGQKLLTRDFLVHKNYQEKCHDKHQNCYDVNDIAIAWTEKEFKFGKNVEIAKLNRNFLDMHDKRGYILGWGDNGNLLTPTMLQRGLVKVVGKTECRNFNKQIKIPDTVICLAPVSKKTRAANGDSGGPFVINGVVYGISSLTIYESRQKQKTINLFTDVAEYSNWISYNLLQGPPKERTPTSSKKPGRRRSLSN